MEEKINGRRNGDLGFDEIPIWEKKAVLLEQWSVLLADECDGLNGSIGSIRHEMDLIGLKPESREAMRMMREMREEMAQFEGHAREAGRLEEEDLDVGCIRHEMGLLALDPESGEAMRMMREMREEMGRLEEDLAGRIEALADIHRQLGKLEEEIGREEKGLQRLGHMQEEGNAHSEVADSRDAEPRARTLEEWRKDLQREREGGGNAAKAHGRAGRANEPARA